MDAKKFGEKLYNLRKRDNLTQVQLANKLNVSNKLVSKWENGLSIPNTEMVADICNVFHVEINDLLEINSIAPRKKSRKIILNAKNKKILKISLISFLCLFLFFVSYFHFVPMIFKNYHLNNLSNFADNTFDNGFINFDIQLEVNGKRNRMSHRGYIDNQEILYEIKKNDRQYILIKNEVLIEYAWPRKKPLDTSSITNAKELFSYVCQNIENAGVGFSDNNVKVYKVRKVGTKYKVFFYLNFSSNGVKFKKGVFNIQIKNDKIHKIDFYLDVSVDDKNYSANGFFYFYDYKPDIKLGNTEDGFQWFIEDEDKKNIASLSKEEIGGTIEKKERLQYFSNILGYKDFLIYDSYNSNDFSYNINVLDLTNDKLNSYQFPFDAEKYLLKLVYQDKLYFTAYDYGKYNLYTFDFVSKQFEMLENKVTSFSELILFDKIYIVDYINDHITKYSISLDGENKFQGQIIYQNGDKVLTCDAFKNKVLEYKNNELVKEYLSVLDAPVRLYEINDNCVLTIDKYGNGFWRTKDFKNYTRFPYVTYDSPYIFEVKGGKIYTSHGIFYNDLYKKPLFYDVISNFALLENYEIYIDNHYTYILNKSK